MSANPHQRDADFRSRSGMDAILAKTTNVQSPEEAERDQQQRRYAGLTADAPPVNQTLGGVVSLEKTDLMFVFLAIQTVLLFAIWMEVR